MLGFLSGTLLFLFLKNYLVIFIIVLIFLIYVLIRFKKKQLLILFLLGNLFGFISSINNPIYQEQREYVGIVYERKENYFLFKSNNKNFYIYEKNHEYEVFDILLINGKMNEIDFSSLESEFDFKKYLYNKKVEKQIDVYNIEVKFYNPIRKNKFINYLLSNFNENTKIIIKKFLFYDNNSDFSNNLNILNLASYFTLSGIQLYFLFNLFNKVILFITNNKKKSKTISLILLFPFIILNNYRLSLVKNYIMLINKGNKKISNEKVLMLILLLMIFLNYRFIYSSSFIYVFVVSFGARILNNFINKYDIKSRNIFRIILFSLFINTICIYTNGTINLISILIVPLMIFITQGYLVLFLLSFIVHIPIIINFISDNIIYIIDKLSDIPSLIYINNSLLTICISLVIIFLILYFTDIRLFKINNILILIYYSLIGLCSLPIYSYLSQYVVFINVGQGDCALIHNKLDNILIDVGGSIYKDIASDVLIPYLKRNNINNIDLVFVSHNDYDHMGSLENLKLNYEVGEIIIGSTFYEKVKGDIIFKNLNTFMMGTDENDNSSVIYFNFLNKNFLFMGDAGIRIENHIMNTYKSLDVDIIKIGHHGSSTSSSYKFLKWLNPKEAIISVGKNNYYNHPNEIVIKYLNSLNILIKRTDLEGSIKYE